MSIEKTRLKSISIKQLNKWFSHISSKLLSGKRGKFIAVLFFLLSIVIIAGVLFSNREILLTFNWQLRPIWLLYITIFFLIDLLVATWVWHLLMTKLANFNNFRRSAKICWSTNLARRIPTPIWYIAGRAVLYEQEGVSKTTTSLLSALELLFFFLSGIAVAIVTLPFWIMSQEVQNQAGQFILLVILLPISLVFIHPQLLKKVWHRLRPDAELQELTWHDTLPWFFYYIITWILGALILFSVINLLYPISFTKIIPLIGIWALAGSISLAGALTISIIGIREISLVILLAFLVPTPIAIIVAIIIRLVWLSGETLGAVIALKL